MDQTTNEIETTLATGESFVTENILIWDPTIIGSGKFGKIYLGHILLQPGSVVAVKVIKNNWRPDIVPYEVQILKRLTQSVHENVVATFGISTNNKIDEYYISMEYCKMGDLESFMKFRMRGFYYEEVRTIMRDMANAIKHIHSLDIIHRDIKLTNILVTERVGGGDMDKHQFKLGDFGLSCILEKGETMTGSCGTYDYMAPELIYDLPYNHSVDLYSLGITLHELIFGDTKLDDRHRHPHNGMKALFELLQGLLRNDPDDRLDAEGLWNHPFIL